MHRQAIKKSTSDLHVPASNTAAVITYAAVSDKQHVISGVAWSYSAAPTGGRLTVENGAGTTVFDLDITTGGPGFIPFDPPLAGSTNTAMVITLAAGGSGISGKVNSLAHWKE